MRSTATPMDHIDMKNNTIAMALATIVIVPHMSTRFSPPSIVRLLKKSPRFVFKSAVLTQREIDGNRHDDRHRNTIEQRGRVLPLLHRFDSGRVKQRN